MKRWKRYLCILFLAGISACAAPPKAPVPVEPPPVEHSQLLINDALIDEKIRFMEKILGRKDLSVEDQKTALAVLNAYKQLKDSAAFRLSEKDYQELVFSLFKAISLMDEMYFEERERSPDPAGAMALFTEKRRAVIDAYLQGHYRAVIEKSRALESVFGKEALTPEVGLLLALSLAKVGHLEQAVQTGEAMAHDMDQLPDRVQIQAKIAQWQMALGKTDDALQTYQKLADHQKKQRTQVERLGRQVGDGEDGRVPPPVTADVPQVPATVDEDWPEQGYTMEELLQKIRFLTENHAYSKARILILKERIRIGDGPENEVLDRELERIAAHEAQFQEPGQEQGPGQVQEAYLEQTRETARRLIEEEKYEAAIEAFRQIEAAQPLDPEAEALKTRAIESLVNRERNRAAELFLEAKKTADPEKKRAFLESASNILRGVMARYPSSPLNPKLKSHIAIVERELDRLR